jgi:hypothetical protein
MKSWQIVRLVAGIFILASLAMGIEASPIFVSPWWLALTQWCMMESILRKFGVQRGC